MEQFLMKFDESFNWIRQWIGIGWNIDYGRNEFGCAVVYCPPLVQWSKIIVLAFALNAADHPVDSEHEQLIRQCIKGYGISQTKLYQKMTI